MDNINTDINNISSLSREEYWKEQVRLKQASGLSRRSYCRKHNLSNSQFAYWESKLKQDTTELIAVKVKQQQMVIKPSALCTLFFGSNELQIHDAGILPVLLSILR